MIECLADKEMFDIRKIFDTIANNKEDDSEVDKTKGRVAVYVIIVVVILVLSYFLT